MLSLNAHSPATGVIPASRNAFATAAASMVVEATAVWARGTCEG